MSVALSWDCFLLGETVNLFVLLFIQTGKTISLSCWGKMFHVRIVLGKKLYLKALILFDMVGSPGGEYGRFLVLVGDMGQML